MIIAANFKCNHTRASFAEYADKLEEILKSQNLETDFKNPQIRANNQIIIAPTASAFLDRKCEYFKQAAQNIYPCINGAFTGEIGLAHLEEFGIDTVILGHCERRNLGESDEFLARKFTFAKEHNLQIIYCIGESAEVYESGKRLEFCAKQLEHIDTDYENLIIAYEPIYSIGKSAASIEDIQEMIAHLRSLSGARLLYGGSVNASNIARISQVADGVLIGSASLDVNNFADLITRAIG